ncbi:unnamed protein product [Caenorhabditis sp. 36 PRJEB53466]|nr:unnamed protein product [Caenorhabditis sp. 36 PRJEB53466]
MKSMMLKLSVLLLLFLVLRESAAVRGALFRSGRAVPYERVPGQQDFLRFGRAGGTSGGAEGAEFIRIAGEPELQLVYR